jgi:hypothetical protein
MSYHRSMTSTSPPSAPRAVVLATTPVQDAKAVRHQA